MLNGINCLKPEKIQTAGNLNVICFDKTGTLTQLTIIFKKILLLSKNNSFDEIKAEDIPNSQNENIEMARLILGNCHSLSKINGTLMGDELEMELFKKGLSENVKLVNFFEFDTEKMMMSCIIEFNEEYFLLTKGSPEKILEISVNQSKSTQ